MPRWIANTYKKILVTGYTAKKLHMVLLNDREVSLQDYILNSSIYKVKERYLKIV